MDETHILLGPDVAIQKSKLGRPQQESIAQLEGESELWSCVRSLTDVGSRCSPQNLQVQEGLIPELKKLKIGETKRGHPADILGLVAGNKIDRERGVGKGSGSTNHGRVSQKKSHSTSHCALGHSKRAETSHHGRRGRDGEGEDRTPQRRIKPRSGPARRRLTFACPFYLHNKEAHRGCLNYELKRIVDVRQHIYRSHVQSSYCSRCGIEFQDDHNYSQRDAHITEGNCAVNSNIPLHTGATSDQLGNMSNPATHGRGANDEERWYSIWRIMFPGDDDPPSPYIDVNREWTCIEINAAIIRFRQNGGIQDFVSGLSLEDGFGVLDHFLDYFRNATFASAADYYDSYDAPSDTVTTAQSTISVPPAASRLLPRPTNIDSTRPEQASPDDGPRLDVDVDDQLGYSNGREAD